MKAGTMMRTIRIPAVDSRNHALPVRCRTAGGTKPCLKRVNIVRPPGMGLQDRGTRMEGLQLVPLILVLVLAVVLVSGRGSGSA
jgi:hypothetical protein